ncbi:MAG: hypothetical protein BWY74_04470 [Firmicutes bacterium ADurb.Bin419]|nr:MAG: hypothetical protein BWY74_04470 [Firmicutes bacterium ADurb.Bin419]
MLLVPMAAVPVNAGNDAFIITFGYKINRLSEEVTCFIIYKLTREVEYKLSVTSAVLHVIILKYAVVSFIIIFIFLLYTRITL